MLNVGSVVAQIKATTDQFHAGVRDAKDQLTGLSSTAEKTSKALTNAGKTLSGVGTKLTKFVTLPLIAAGGATIKFASDAEETRSKFETVFGDMADDVNRWAEQLGRDVGRARTDIRGWSATLQDTFVPMGMAREQAADLSKGLVELAIDVASFNNVADSQVIENFTSAIVGNHQAVAKYGIIINETRLQQEALNRGLDPKNLTENEKAFLRYQIILASSGDAMGDARRTAASFANQMKALRAGVRNLAEDVGEMLLPTATKVVGWLREGADWFSRLNPGVRETAIRVAAVVAALGLLTLVLGKAMVIGGKVLGFVGKLNPQILAITAVLGLLYTAWKHNWGGLQDLTRQVVQRIEAFFGRARDALGVLAEVWQSILAGDLPGALGHLPGFVRSVFGDGVVGVFRSVVGYVESAAGAIGAIWGALVSTLGNVVAGLQEKILPIIVAVWEFLQDLFRSEGDGLGTVWATVWSGVAETVTTALRIVQEVVSWALGIVAAFWERNGQNILVGVKFAWKQIVLVIETAVNLVKNILGLVLAVITGDWARAWEYIKNLGAAAWKFIVQTFVNADVILFNIGKAIITGLWQGISSLHGWLTEKLTGFVQNVIVGPIKKLLRIGSPSKLMEEYGAAVSQGLANGITNRGVAVERAVEQVSKKSAFALQVLQAEFDLAVARMGDAAGESERLATRLFYQERQMTLTTERVQVLRQAYEDLRRSQGEAAEATQRLYLELLKEEKAQAELAQTIAEAQRAQQPERRSVDVDAIHRLRPDEVVYIRHQVATGGQISEAGLEAFREALEQEARAIAVRRGIDLGVAKAMAEANQLARAEGRVPEYHQGGLVTAPAGVKEVLARLVPGEIVMWPRQLAEALKSVQPAVATSAGPIYITVHAQDGTDAGQRIARELRRRGL